MRKRWLFIIVIGLIALSLTKANAEHSRYGPAFLINDAGTEPKGTFEFAGWTPIMTFQPGIRTGLTQLALTYGVTDNLELCVAPEIFKWVEGDKVPEEQNFGDLYLGGKYQILKWEDFVLSGDLLSKIANDSSYKKSGYLSNGADEFKITLIATKILRLWQFDFNLGYKFFGKKPGGCGYPDEFFYGLAMSHPIGKIGQTGVIGIFEVAGKTNNAYPDISIRDNILDINLGAKWWVIENKIGLKAAAGTRVTHTAPELTLFGAFAYYF